MSNVTSQKFSQCCGVRGALMIPPHARFARYLQTTPSGASSTLRGTDGFGQLWPGFPYQLGNVNFKLRSKHKSLSSNNLF